MTNFENEPHNFRQQAKSEIEKAARISGYELFVIEENPQSLRFQILGEEQTGLGEEEHQKYLDHLLETSRVLTTKNTRIISHSTGAFNIEIFSS